jgi:hypothetical protein
MQSRFGAIGISSYAKHLRRGVLAAALLTVAMTAPAAVFASEGVATPFKASYVTPTPIGDSLWTCSGAHVVNRVSIKDSETCLVSGNTTGFVAGTYVGNPTTNIPPFGPNAGWGSDYNGAVATMFTQTFIANGDGTFTMDITAYYN